MDINPNEVRQPLGQFQSTSSNQEDVFRLIETINRACGETALEPSKLQRAFDRTWDELNKKLKDIAKNGPQKVIATDPEATLNEILGYVRSLSREASEISSILTTEEIVILGKIFTINEHLNIAGIGQSWIILEDGTHGTQYKLNRRFLGKFLQRVQAQARETKSSKDKGS